MVVHREHGHALVAYDNVLLVVSTEAPSLRVMKTIVSELFVLSSRYRTPVGAMLVVRSDVRVPGEEARNYIREQLAHAPLAAAAQVVIGTGFMGAAMRSALSMLQLLASFGFSLRTFGELEDAAKWLSGELARRVERAPDARALAAAAGKLHAELTGNG